MPKSEFDRRLPVRDGRLKVSGVLGVDGETAAGEEPVHVHWVLEQAYPIDDEAGEPWLIQGVIFDITERKRAEEQVAFLAYHDKLTGLPNRALFEEMLETAIARVPAFGEVGIKKVYNGAIAYTPDGSPIIEVKSPIRKMTWCPRSCICRILLRTTVCPM